MNKHWLKTWPDPFEAVLSGAKRAEFRINDRDYQVGDHLQLMEWNPGLTAEGELDSFQRGFTRRDLVVRVTHVQLGGQFGIPEGFAMLSVEVIK